MEIIIFFIVVALVSYVIASFRTSSKSKVDIDTKEFNEEIINNPIHEQSWNVNHKQFYHKGIQRVSIAGLSYRDISVSDLGYFEGYLIKEPDNNYDKNAIAIYSDSKHKHIGYIPKLNNRQIANSTDVNYLSVFGYIEPEYDNDKQDYVGEVFIPITATDDQIDKCKEKLKSLV